MKKAVLTFGIIFLIVGILGFIPNSIVGPGAIFEANAVHNIVHLIFGIGMILIAISAPAKSAITLKVVGVIYLIVAILGFFAGSVLGLFAVNTADNWLHIVLAIVIGGAGFMMGKKMDAPDAPAPTPMAQNQM